MLAGCAFQGPGSGLQLPNTTQTDRVRTQAVATAYAMLTAQASQLPETSSPQAAPSATPLPPTSSPSPTSAAPAATVWTATPTTARPAVQDYPTFTATPAQIDYLCSVEEIEPEAGQTVKVGADFDAAVRLKNTGDKGWSAGKILLTYTSGQKMQTKASAVVLFSQVDVDGSAVFTIDMKAPDVPGTYKATWALMSAPLFFCPVHFQVVVTP